MSSANEPIWPPTDHERDVMAGFAFGAPVDVDGDLTISRRGISSPAPMTKETALERVQLAMKRERERHAVRISQLEKALELLRDNV